MCALSLVIRKKRFRLPSPLPILLVECSKVISQPHFLSFFSWTTSVPSASHAFQSCYQLCCPSLEAFKWLNILLIFWGPNPRTVLSESAPVLNLAGESPLDWVAMLCVMHPIVLFTLQGTTALWWFMLSLIMILHSCPYWAGITDHKLFSIYSRAKQTGFRNCVLWNIYICNRVYH